MVTGDENSIKLIYATQYIITLMVTLNTSRTWSNDHTRVFRVSYPYDDYRERCANGNAPCVVIGDGNYMITGHADVPGHCKTFGDGP